VLARLARRASDEAAARRKAQVASDEEAPVFRLLGGTRSVQGVVLSALSAPRLPGRTVPTSLDILAALGSKAARAAVPAATPGYDRTLAGVRHALEDLTSVPRAVSSAGSGFERSRLFAIAKLLERPPSGAPSCQQSLAYSDRLLLGALGALNEPRAWPRHKGPPSPAGGGGPVPRFPREIAVEPLPGFYARLAHGARRLLLGLDALPGSPGGPELVRAKARLAETASTLEGLALAAQEVLSDRPHSPVAQDALVRFVQVAAEAAPEAPWSVDDLHVLARGGTHEILERTTGPLDRLVLVLPVPGEPGRLRVATGPVLAAREVTVHDERLTPDAVARGERAPDPVWASHVVR
jgi:hypothetical protein